MTDSGQADRKMNYIEKDATNYIKGIALVFMFIHHFFTFPDWYVNGISYEYLSAFAGYMCIPLKICVPAFAFLTGYFYFYSKNKTVRYSIRKSTDVWVTYVVVFLVLLIPALLLRVYDFSVKDFVLEVFALKYSVMCFCWYVTFYITTVFILPFYAKLSEKAPCFCFLSFLSVPAIVLAFLQKIPLGEAGRLLKIIEYLSWFPSVGIGFLFAKYDLFYEFQNLVKTKKRFLNILVGFLFILLAMIGRLVDCPDIFCAPFFIFGLMEIYHNTKWTFLYKPIMLIGKYSLIMWFLHCIFFNQCQEFTQPILYFPKEPILVVLWGLLMCLIVAMIVQIPVNVLIKIKNKLLRLNNN